MIVLERKIVQVVRQEIVPKGQATLKRYFVTDSSRRDTTSNLCFS